MKIIINENQRGLKFKNGIFTAYLKPGKYKQTKNIKIEVCNLDTKLSSNYSTVKTLLNDESLKKDTVQISLKDNEVSLHFVDDIFKEILTAGEHVFWTVNQSHEFKVYDTDTVMLDDTVAFVAKTFHKGEITSHPVYQSCCGVLFYDEKFVKLLDAGTYYFWTNSKTKVNIVNFDTRKQTFDLSGQEILSADKVTLRLNFVCTFRYTDYVKIATEVDDVNKQLHTITQLILRKHISCLKLDEILEHKTDLSKAILEDLKQAASLIYIDIEEAGIRDVILPGEIREIMNRVLIAEKQAQANIITRREETATTRSMLNTAKLMEENPVLFKLKEYEYIERICEKVGTINIGANSDILTGLTNIISNNALKGGL